MALIDNGDGTLTDRDARLMWQKDDDGVQRTYQDAADYCASLSLASFSDWHLPELEEFRLLRAAGGNTRSPHGGANAEYWTASEPAPFSIPEKSRAYVVGKVACTSEGLTFSKEERFYVRACRRLSSPPPFLTEQRGEGRKAATVSQGGGAAPFLDKVRGLYGAFRDRVVKELSEAPELDVGGVAQELRRAGRQCLPIHQMIADAMAQRLERAGSNQAIRQDVARDIQKMAGDVAIYDPGAAANLRAVARRLESR